MLELDDRYDVGKFGLNAVARITDANEIKLTRWHTDCGYYLYLDGELFCSIVNNDHLTHLFELLKRRVV